MALIDHEMPIGRCFGRLASTPAPKRVAGALSASAVPEALAARSLTCVGALALLLLPGLMVASLVAEVPLAVPAVLALGFLAVAHAISARRNALAAAWTAFVLGGMLLWTLVAPLATGNGGSPVWAAIALVPVFAAAPALVQRLIPKLDLAVSAGRPDQVAPERPATAADFQITAPLVQPPPADFAVSRPARPKPSPLAPCGLPGTAVEPGPTSSLDEAVGFAVRLLAPEARGRSVAIAQQDGSSGLVRCGRSDCRRIALNLLRDAIRRAPEGGEVIVSTRMLRGAVLLRLADAEVRQPSGSPMNEDTAFPPGDTDELIQEIGGTILFDQRPGGGTTVSVRLPAAVNGTGSATA